MHKLESFALSCGSKISKPHIETNFFPITYPKYICTSQYSNSLDNQYDYWDDVIFHIKGYLDHNNIELIEIGPKPQSPLFYTKKFNHLTRLQTNYILSKSLMYLGNYNFFSHIAPHFGKQFISPSENDFIETNRPYWHQDLSSLLLPDEKDRPYFNKQEPHKSINSIMPETIACMVLDKLNIKHNLQAIETIHIGDLYKSRYVELIPGQYNPYVIDFKGEVTVRLDKQFDLNFLPLCSEYKSINIVTNKPLKKDSVSSIQDKINSISYFIDNKTTVEDINETQSIGKTLNLYCDKPKQIQKLRFKFIDFNIKEYKHKSKKDLNVKTYSDLEFLSRKNIIHNSKAYNSFISLSLGSNTPKVHNNQEMWQDLDYIRIYRKSS